MAAPPESTPRPRLALVTFPQPSADSEPPVETRPEVEPEPEVLVPQPIQTAAPSREPSHEPPALTALEDLLEAILREKQELAAESAVASR